MNDGAALLKAVMRSRVREDAAIAALTDYLLDHVPEVGTTLRLDAIFRVRKGAVVAWWVPVPAPPLPIARLCLRVDCHHSRGNRGSRSMTLLIDPLHPFAVRDLRKLMSVFRS